MLTRFKSRASILGELKKHVTRNLSVCHKSDPRLIVAYVAAVTTTYYGFQVGLVTGAAAIIMFLVFEYGELRTHCK